MVYIELLHYYPAPLFLDVGQIAFFLPRLHSSDRVSVSHPGVSYPTFWGHLCSMIAAFSYCFFLYYVNEHDSSSSVTV